MELQLYLWNNVWLLILFSFKIIQYLLMKVISKAKYFILFGLFILMKPKILRVIPFRLFCKQIYYRSEKSHGKYRSWIQKLLFRKNIEKGRCNNCRSISPRYSYNKLLNELFNGKFEEVIYDRQMTYYLIPIWFLNIT